MLGLGGFDRYRHSLNMNSNRLLQVPRQRACTVDGIKLAAVENSTLGSLVYEWTDLLELSCLTWDMKMSVEDDLARMQHVPEVEMWIRSYERAIDFYGESDPMTWRCLLNCFKWLKQFKEEKDPSLMWNWLERIGDDARHNIATFLGVMPNHRTALVVGNCFGFGHYLYRGYQHLANWRGSLYRPDDKNYTSIRLRQKELIEYVNMDVGRSLVTVASQGSKRLGMSTGGLGLKFAFDDQDLFITVSIVEQWRDKEIASDRLLMKKQALRGGYYVGKDDSSVMEQVRESVRDPNDLRRLWDKVMRWQGSYQPRILCYAEQVFLYMFGDQAIDKRYALELESELPGMLEKRHEFFACQVRWCEYVIAVYGTSVLCKTYFGTYMKLPFAALLADANIFCYRTELEVHDYEIPKLMEEMYPNRKLKQDAMEINLRRCIVPFGLVMGSVVPEALGTFDRL